MSTNANINFINQKLSLEFKSKSVDLCQANGLFFFFFFFFSFFSLVSLHEQVYLDFTTQQGIALPQNLGFALKGMSKL
ncbi:hypothetical protein J1614_002302 [Plenodomus biglobosus]|nr:hypothetical protein J1614_002302 [Plenodomus biglobosus]